MAQSVKLADEVMTAVRREAELHSRSVAGQITHWLRLGKAIEQSGAYDHARVTATLEGRLDPAELRGEESIAWLDAFTDKMSTPSQTEQDFHAKRQKLGRGVGLDAAGNLVHAERDTAA
ncbi:MAG: TA system antitoxin ParD family protein [Brevundimonas sp.]